MIQNNTPETPEQKLIRLFKFETHKPPYYMSWEYRKSYSTYKQDLVVLLALQKQGRAKLISKTPKTVTWEYIEKESVANIKFPKMGTFIDFAKEETYKN